MNRWWWIHLISGCPDKEIKRVQFINMGRKTIETLQCRKCKRKGKVIIYYG